MPQPAPARVLLLTDAAMTAHVVPGHPERPERLEAAVLGVAEGAATAGARLDRPDVTPADDATIGLVHEAWFMDALEAVEARGGGWIDADTYVGPGSMAAARLAAGATLQGALAAAGGEAAVAFAVVRPPGHHAGAERAAGFCLLNNVAVAAAALREGGLAQRLAVVDWDVHHGDGTQGIFDADPDLCYASTHQSPFYPGTGDPSERGSGAAIGTKHNVPLPAGSGDAAFTAAWLEQLLPAVESFRPEAILVSAGYDAHRDDPLASLEVTEAGYATVAEAVGRLSARLAIPGVALTLEGGYDLQALRASVAATVTGLLAGQQR
ncbi:MAG TPA: histone deacetylase [Candidatus Dormibacteraeota bacterium]|nr:histone deacetylase [Candidatus Dormibacteraeota bacterium]